MDSERDVLYENCLCGIVALEYKNTVVTPSALAEHLGKPRALVRLNLDKLSAQNLLTYGGGDQIRLTEAGRARAEALYTHRTFLEQLLLKIGVKPQTARADAERLERNMTEETYRALVQYLREHPL